MRIFLFALMIALLPLRGFAGDVMATEMAIQLATQHSLQGAVHDHHAGATKNVADHAGVASATGHLDAHHELAQTQEAASVADACPAHVAPEQCHAADSHGSCQACQACHTVALSPALTHVSPVLVSSRLPQPAAAQFASAEAALGQKPPIS
jgi:hypothetical protein